MILTVSAVAEEPAKKKIAPSPSPLKSSVGDDRDKVRILLTEALGTREDGKMNNSLVNRNLIIFQETNGNPQMLLTQLSKISFTLISLTIHH